MFRENGIPCRLAPNINEANGYGINSSIEYFNATLNPTSRHPKIFLFDDLSMLIEEIERYSWAFFTKGESRGMSKDKPRKGFDDCINALQFILAMRPKPRRGTQTLEDRKEMARFLSYT